MCILFVQGHRSVFLDGPSAGCWVSCSAGLDVLIMKVQIETTIDVIVTGDFISGDPDYLPGSDYLEDVVVKLPDGYEITSLFLAHQMEELEDLLLAEGRKRSKR